VVNEEIGMTSEQLLVFRGGRALAVPHTNIFISGASVEMLQALLEIIVQEKREDAERRRNEISDPKANNSFAERRKRELEEH